MCGKVAKTLGARERYASSVKWNKGSTFEEGEGGGAPKGRASCADAAAAVDEGDNTAPAALAPPPARDRGGCVKEVVSSVIWRSASRHHCSSFRSNVTEPLAATVAESVGAAAAGTADDEDAAVACAAATSAAAPLTLAARELALLLALLLLWLLWLLLRRVLLVGGLPLVTVAAAVCSGAGAGDGDGEGDAPKNQPNIIGRGREGRWPRTSGGGTDGGQ